MVQPNLNLSPNKQERIRNIEGVQMGISVIGLIGGIIYAHKTGTGFWRAFGYSILGSLITGVPAALILTPFKNKILKEGDINAPASSTNTNNSADTKTATMKDIEKTINTKTTFQKK